jgi:acetyl/propionyl-CoA carboxylase alpha subunit
MDQQQPRGVSMSVTLHIDGRPVTLQVIERTREAIHFTMNGQNYRFSGQALDYGGFVLEEETTAGLIRRSGISWPAGKGVCQIRLGALEAKISEASAAASGASNENALSPLAPMPGLVRQVLVKKGDKVAEGQPLIVVEAMKLQLTLSAGGDATVEAVLVKVGELVAEGAELVKLKAKK